MAKVLLTNSQRGSTLSQDAAYSYMVDMNQLAKNHNLKHGTIRIRRIVSSTERLPLV